MKKYDDIINLPYKKSTARKQMSILDRAAQFAPFAALTGHDEAIQETARLTNKKIYLDEYEIEELNRKILKLKDQEEISPKISVTYFVPDLKKDGGEYVTKSGNLKRIKDTEQAIVFTDGSVIEIENIIEIIPFSLQEDLNII